MRMPSLAIRAHTLCRRAASGRARTARPAEVPLLHPPPVTKQGLRCWSTNASSSGARSAKAARGRTQPGSGSASGPGWDGIASARPATGLS